MMSDDFTAVPSIIIMRPVLEERREISQRAPRTIELKAARIAIASSV